MIRGSCDTRRGLLSAAEGSTCRYPAATSLGTLQIYAREYIAEIITNAQAKIEMYGQCFANGKVMVHCGSLILRSEYDLSQSLGAV